MVLLNPFIDDLFLQVECYTPKADLTEFERWRGGFLRSLRGGTALVASNLTIAMCDDVSLAYDSKDHSWSFQICNPAGQTHVLHGLVVDPVSVQYYKTFGSNSFNGDGALSETVKVMSLLMAREAAQKIMLLLTLLRHINFAVTNLQIKATDFQDFELVRVRSLLNAFKIVCVNSWSDEALENLHTKVVELTRQPRRSWRQEADPTDIESLVRATQVAFA